DMLSNDSYQLYLAPSSDENVATDNAVPGTLWIFEEGSAFAPAAVVFFEAVLYRGSLAEKQEAIRELRRLGTPVAIQALSLALADENGRVRDSAFAALENVGSGDALGAIASAAMDSDAWIRSEAATALASGDNETLKEYLVKALDNPDPRVRMSVVEALADVPWGAMTNQQLVAALNRALKDENPEVRMKAIDSLEEIGGNIAFQALMQAKKDQDSDVADPASESLSSLYKQK
ncbi:MAG: HEAT repeat domain-containing protein, partial [Pseudomonadales bacterium]